MSAYVSDHTRIAVRVLGVTILADTIHLVGNAVGTVLLRVDSTRAVLVVRRVEDLKELVRPALGRQPIEKL